MSFNKIDLMRFKLRIGKRVLKRYTDALLARCRRDAGPRAHLGADGAGPLEDGMHAHKAHSIAQSVASTDIILGSDQVAHLEDGSILHKPGDFDHARAQLMRCSDQWVYFSTGICLVRGSRSLIVDSETYRIRFRPLTTPTIESYLERDRPYDCAGSIKAEGLGITLLADAEGRDVNTLYGLPLMLLTDHLINLDIIS